MDDEVLRQALRQRLTAWSREESAAEGRRRHATQPSAVVGGGGGRPLAGAVGTADDPEAAPRDDNGGTHTLPVGGGHLQLLEPSFEHEATTGLEEVTEMLQRGSSSEFFNQIMEFFMRLPNEPDDIGDMMDQIYYDQDLAAGVQLNPLPEDGPDEHDNDGGGRGFGGGVVPASSVVVAGLEKRKYQRSSSTGQDDDDDNQCPICLMEYAVDDELCVMPCKHGFHHECLEGWLARSCLCPLCRHVLPSAESEEQDI